MAPALPPIIIDTREQRPFEFDGYQTARGTLKTGDYSLKGLETVLAVERKSYNDCWQSMSVGRARFGRCVERLAALDRAAIVIECSLTQLAVQPPRIQRTNAASVVGGLVSWACQYQIPVFWCDSREYAERVTLRFLAAYYKHSQGATWPLVKHTGPLPVTQMTD